MSKELQATILGFLSLIAFGAAALIGIFFVTTLSSNANSNLDKIATGMGVLIAVCLAIIFRGMRARLKS